MQHKNASKGLGARVQPWPFLAHLAPWHLLTAGRLQPAPVQTRQATLSPKAHPSEKNRNAPVEEQADGQMLSSEKI